MSINGNQYTIDVSSYTSVLPKIVGFESRPSGNQVTTAYGSEVPLNAPATFPNLVARSEIFIMVILDFGLFMF